MTRTRPSPVLTNQRQSDGRHEDHNAAQQRHQEVAGHHDHGHKRRGVLPLEAVDGGPVVAGPYGAQEDEGHHGHGGEHPHWVQEPAGVHTGEVKAAEGIRQTDRHKNRQTQRPADRQTGRQEEKPAKRRFTGRYFDQLSGSTQW